MPGGGGSTGKARTPVLPGFGKGRLLRLVGKRGALIQDPKDQRDTEYQEVFQRRQWQRFRLPLRAGPSPLIPPPQGTRAEENTGCRCLTPPWRTRRPSQPDLREAVPNHRAGAAGSARESSGGQFSSSRSQISVLGCSGPWRAAATRAAEGRGRVYACAGKAALPAAAAAPAPAPPPSQARTARPRPRRRPEPPLSSLAFASRVSCRSPSPGPVPGAAAERLPAGERLRARTGAGGGGPVRGGRAGGRRAQRRWPPSPRLLVYSPPPALLSLPPLPSVIDPSRAPLLPPPGPF